MVTTCEYRNFDRRRENIKSRNFDNRNCGFKYRVFNPKVNIGEKIGVIDTISQTHITSN